MERGDNPLLLCLGSAHNLRVRALTPVVARTPHGPLEAGIVSWEVLLQVIS